MSRPANSLTKSERTQSRQVFEGSSQQPITPLFHLLVSEATANWKQAALRSAVGRALDHVTMKAASNRIQDVRDFPTTGHSVEVVAKLKAVAKAFVQLQDKRHIADYDNSVFWTRTEALSQVRSAELAFESWKAIREQDIAQAFLVSLLAKKRS